MDSLGVVTVGGEGFFEGHVEYFMAPLRLIFVNQFVPPIYAREERFAVGPGKLGGNLHREYRLRQALFAARINTDLL